MKNWLLLWVSLAIIPVIGFAATPTNVVDLMEGSTVENVSEEEALLVNQTYDYKDSLQRDTPRGTLNGFTRAVYEQDYDTAAEYLDLRYLPDSMSKDKGAQYAKQLQAIIDRNIWIDIEQINDTPEGADGDQLPSYRDLFGRVKLQSDEIALYLQRVPGDNDSIWKISNATVAKVPTLYANLGYGPITEWFIAYLPEGRILKVNIWEWAVILTYLVIAFCVIIPITWLCKLLILRTDYHLKTELAYIVAGPLRFFLAVLVVRTWVSSGTISAAALEVLDTGFLSFISIVWLGWSGMGILQSGLKQRLIDKGQKQGASLLRPLTNFIRVIFVILAILIWLEHLGFNAGTIIAGMGIGGIAVALASKQSIENFIGTITLYSAAPIKVGNLCKFGSIRGTVEEIGLRCTQIRTLDRTLIHVPNAKLVEMEIENISEREKIRFKADIRLDYLMTDTEKLKGIIADIKEMLELHELVMKEPLRVTFKGFGLHGLQVNIFAYIGTKSFPKYQVVSEELHLGIMDIVTKHGSRIIPVAPVALNSSQ
ncbi:mechanosensitive ion channel family protein [Shewanella psychrotolerans]|uniref:mechanosensitive ion channel family protein n=1 Tax=Shewanella psychrotolerans TaxID=2864206 RepID=UPI001C65525D|nr:mechanosensitive ion channel domain-containing protein [Shewanella psychrotolerans]QYK00008.1 mechanosensitive ion channel family protein [Shewanella psychrotolerans]